MFSLDMLTGPLMKAASSLKKLPAQPLAKPSGTGQALDGIFGKTGTMLSQPVSQSGADGLPNVPPTAPPQLSAASFDPLVNRMPVTRMPENPKVEDVPIPALPGRTGGPRPFDANTKAEFDYVMSKIPRDAAGSERKPSFGERFKSSLLPALLGTVQGVNSPAGQRNPVAGAIGGAAAGFGGGMIDPISARQYEFNQMYLPELEQQQDQRDRETETRRKADEALVNLEARRAGINHTKAQTEVARTNAEANQAYKQSQAELNDARTKAALTGKPEYKNFVVNGVSGTYEIYPGKEPRLLGESEKAYLQQQGILSKEKIADKRNETQLTITDKKAKAAMEQTVYKDRGQTTRTAMTQAGQNQRSAAKPGATPTPKSKSASTKVRTRQGFITDAIAGGYSKAEAEAFAEKMGLK